MRLNIQVRLYPNKTMQTVLDSLCDYRRYCWNQGLERWNTMYEARLIGLPIELRAKIKASLTDKTIQFSEEEQALRALFPAPAERKVRDELVAQKADWQFEFSARVLQQAIKDLAVAWKLFFNNPKTVNKPGFQSRKKPKQGFKTDSARIKNGRLVLDKPHAYKGGWSSIRFKGANIPDGHVKLCAVTRTKGKYIATITMDVETVALPKTGKKTAVDANVDHFDTTEGQTSLKPELLDLCTPKFVPINGNSTVNAKSIRTTDIQKGIKQREPSCKQPTNEFAIFKMTYSTSLPLTCIVSSILS